MRPTTIIAGAVLLAAQPALAASVRYVTDALRLESRSGPGTSNRIVRMLESGTRLSVLEEDNGWSRIALPDGGDAWILTRYLMDQPSARDRLATAEEGMATATERVATAQRQTQELRSENDSLKEVREELENKVVALTDELSNLKRTAGAAISLREENRALTGRASALEERYRILEQEHDTLRSARSRDWFLAGAGVLFGGVVLGLVIPKLRFRRRRGWGEL